MRRREERLMDLCHGKFVPGGVGKSQVREVKERWTGRKVVSFVVVIEVVRW
jgi:hypothetical protein